MTMCDNIVHLYEPLPPFSALKFKKTNLSPEGEAAGGLLNGNEVEAEVRTRSVIGPKHVQFFETFRLDHLPKKLTVERTTFKIDRKKIIHLKMKEGDIECK